jgi:two-component system, cell cycle response regulator
VPESETPSSSHQPRPVAGSTLVVADDDRLTREALTTVLEGHGFRVEAVGDGQAAIERVGRGGVDLVLLDILMPKLTGLEACRLIKGMTSHGFLPVVLLTVRTDSASRVEGLRIGADDYVCKPFDEQELIARVESMLRIKKLYDHVAEARARLEQLSLFDPLTGLFNYRYLHVRLNEEFKRAERYHDPLACMVIDIDNLRGHNEAFGRAEGDRAICRVAEALRRSVREVDVVARFGGDEFLVLLPSTHFAGATTVAERLFRELHETAPSERAPDPLSLSVGIALYPSRDVRSKDQLLRAADAAMHHAKREGSGRISVYQQHGQLYTPLSHDPPASAKPLSSGLSSARSLPAFETSSSRPPSDRGPE